MAAADDPRDDPWEKARNSPDAVRIRDERKARKKAAAESQMKAQNSGATEVDPDAEHWRRLEEKFKAECASEGFQPPRQFE